MSRLTIEITEQQHQSIKAMAALQGQSIREYAMQRLLPLTGDEEQAMQELKTLLTARIAEAERGAVSSKTFSQVVEDTLQSGRAA